MNTDRQDGEVTEQDMITKMATGMFRAVERNYAQLLAAAKREWERNYADSDSSESCVSVRISSGKQPALASASEITRDQSLEEKPSFASAAV